PILACFQAPDILILIKPTVPVRIAIVVSPLHLEGPIWRQLKTCPAPHGSSSLSEKRSQFAEGKTAILGRRKTAGDSVHLSNIFRFVSDCTRVEDSLVLGRRPTFGKRRRHRVGDPLIQWLDPLDHRLPSSTVAVFREPRSEAARGRHAGFPRFNVLAG